MVSRFSNGYEGYGQSVQQPNLIAIDEYTGLAGIGRIPHPLPKDNVESIKENEEMNCTIAITQYTS